MHNNTLPSQYPDESFGALFDEHGAIMLLIDSSTGLIRNANQAAAHFYGYTRSELCTMSVEQLCTAEPKQCALMYQQALRKEQNRFVLVHQIASGEYRTVEVHASPVTLDGQLVLFAIIHDITEREMMSHSAVFDNTQRKQVEDALRESEEQNRLLFEESPDAVVLLRADGTLVQLNRAFEQLTGYNATQLLGQTLNSVGLIPREATRQLDRLVTEHLQTGSDVAAIELRLRRADGEFCDIGVRVFGLPIRGHQHYLATMRDITTEKQVEETLRQANAELARAARAKDEFLATMSHELRTPLSSILGLSESLLEQIRGPLTEYQQEAVRNIEASGRHLLALITDILDLSKVEAGRLDLQVEAVNVADVCHASLLFVKEQAVKKALRLAFTLNNQMAEMEADPRRLKQMLVNLLSNAVKFTPARGQVRLEVEVDARAAVIHFAVRDTGIGIAPEDLGRLFQPFKQLDSRLSRQHEGTGLGLALVRRLAELHGGSVMVESMPNQGSCFTISLPYYVPPPINTGLSAHPAALDSPTNALQSALVVEDSESAAEQLARYLHEASMRVLIHSQGVDALEQAIRLQPTVIFLDLLMPDRSGWEVLTQLKSNPRTRDIPVVIVSVIDDQTYGLNAGAVAYMVKPVTRESLRKVLAVVASSITSEAQQALVIVPQQTPLASGGTRILLVEDNEVNLLTISAYLQARGYILSIARNGQEALNQVDEAQPELILMDIQMPEMDGLEATRRLRAMPAYVQVPIIALTALVMPGDRERCLQAGANAYLTKPVSLRGLADTIEELLHRRSGL